MLFRSQHPIAHSDHPHHHGAADLTDAPGAATDPVCGMRVDRATAQHRHAHGDTEYVFCSKHCLEKFRADPSRYVAPASARGTVADDAAIYTCPMHPQIRQLGPGHCPICGMALEPEQVSAQSASNPELVDMTHRFWIGLLLTV